MFTIVVSYLTNSEFTTTQRFVINCDMVTGATVKSYRIRQETIVK